MIVLENLQNKKELTSNDKVPDEAVIQEAVLKYDTVSCYFMTIRPNNNTNFYENIPYSAHRYLSAHLRGCPGPGQRIRG
jgi:hypothetical protein